MFYLLYAKRVLFFVDASPHKFKNVMQRGSNSLENGSPDGDTALGAVQRPAGMGLCIPLQYADQTAA
jgi:hypothetical protein